MRTIVRPKLKEKELSLKNIKPTQMIEWFGGVYYDNLRNVIEEVKTKLIENPEEEIHLVISSCGGATGIGMAFFDTIKSVLKVDLTTIGSGDVDSSGIIVFLAGKKRYLTKNTTLLLHLAGRTFDGNKRYSTSDMSLMLKEDTLKDFHYASVVSDATEGRRTTDEILELMAKNTLLTTEEAVNLGIAHGIIE